MSVDKAINTHSDDRHTTWVCVCYPESLPTNWLDILDEQCVPFCVSPLHDKDIDGDGKPKKAHYHVLFKWGSKKSFEQVKSFLAPLNCPNPQYVSDLRGQVRYFAHLDSPHKAQYPSTEIIGHCGFDPSVYVGVSTAERYTMLADMVDFIVKNYVTEFIDFQVYCKDFKFDSWWQLLCDGVGVNLIERTIKSNRHRGGSVFINYDTGEVRFDYRGREKKDPNFDPHPLDQEHKQ